LSLRSGIQGGPKNGTIFVRQILTNFQNYFTVRIRRKFVIILPLKIPANLKGVATHYLVKCRVS